MTLFPSCSGSDEQRGSSSYLNSFQRWSFWFSCFLGEAKGAQVSHRMPCVPLLETTVWFYACGWSGDHHFTCVRSAAPDGSQESPFSRTAKEILMILSAPRMAEWSPSKTRPPVNRSECYVQCVAPAWRDSGSVCLAGGKCWELQCWSDPSPIGTTVLCFPSVIFQSTFLSDCCFVSSHESCLQNAAMAIF